MTSDRWQRIIEFLDEAYKDYEWRTGRPAEARRGRYEA